MLTKGAKLILCGFGPCNGDTTIHWQEALEPPLCVLYTVSWTYMQSVATAVVVSCFLSPQSHPCKAACPDLAVKRPRSLPKSPKRANSLGAKKGLFTEKLYLGRVGI